MKVIWRVVTPVMFRGVVTPVMNEDLLGRLTRRADASTLANDRFPACRSAGHE